MNSSDFLTRANALYDELVAARRKIHSFGGTQFDIGESRDFIVEKLTAFGIPYREIIPTGIVATVGHGAPVVLLRADYDALPMQEATGLPYAAENNTCHACGHDLHASSLLYAAKMLKEIEGELSGTVKLMFQPAEEDGGGAERMVAAGVLSDPSVDMAIALHTMVGTKESRVGSVLFSRGPAYAQSDNFTVTVHGRGGHGAQPHTGVDPVTATAQIICALQSVVSREVASNERAVITIASIHGGENAHNVIPEKVTFKGTIRTFNEKIEEFVRDRFIQVVSTVAEAMRARAEIEYLVAARLVHNDETLSDELDGILADLLGRENVTMLPEPTSFGSEDFCEISSRVPSVAIKYGCGRPEDGYTALGHNPAVLFDEKSLPYSAAIYAYAAYRLLQRHGA